MSWSGKRVVFLAAVVAFLAWVGALAAMAVVSSRGPVSAAQGEGD
jgi:hypothetical protein